MAKEKENMCPCCKEFKSVQKGFTDGYGVQMGKKLIYCKQCNKQKLDKYKNFLTDQGAFWVLCAENGLPYIQNVYDYTMEVYAKSYKTVGLSLLDIYVKNLKQLETIYNGFWDSDTTLPELEYKHKEDQTINPKTDFIKLERIWGKFDNPDEAYPFLEELYKD